MKIILQAIDEKAKMKPSLVELTPGPFHGDILINSYRVDAKELLKAVLALQEPEVEKK